MLKGSFNCNGKININDWQLNGSSLFMQNEIDNVLGEKISCSDLIFNVFNCDLPGVNILLNLKHFVRCLEAKLKQLDRHDILTNSGKQSVIETYKHVDFSRLRFEICQFLLYLRNYLLSIKIEQYALKDISDEAEKDFDDLISTVRRFLYRLHRIPDSTFLYATSNVGNKCKQPEYHMYHIHLDLRWLIISLIYTQNNSWGCLDNKSDVLENTIYTIIGDLIYISFKIFETISNTELKLKTPYSCTCMRELWIMLQIFTDDLSLKGKSKIFWVYVSAALKQFFFDESNRDKLVFHRNINLPYCKNSELFCIWLIYHLILLYGYNENGGYCNSPSKRLGAIQMEASVDIVEKILKAYVHKGGKNGARDEIDEELCVIIPLLHVLNLEWWRPQVQIVTLLWDCFHRRLDQLLLMQTRGPWSTSNEKKTPMNILDQVRSRIKSASDTSGEASFSLFLRLLGLMLQNHYDPTDMKIWNQIKGRIYSRFSQAKVQEFSESGLYNFISLFVTMAVTADTANVCSAMVNLLPSVLEWNDSTGARKCCLAWKSKLALLLLYSEQRLPFKDVAEDFTETVNAMSCRKDEYSRSMMSSFIDVLGVVLGQSDDFGRQEHAFLGGWIDRYLLECAPNRAAHLTSLLLLAFQRCIDLRAAAAGSTTGTMGGALLINGLWSHVASRVRQMVTACDPGSDFYENPTRMAALFTLEACRDPATAAKYRHSAVSLFHHLTASIIIRDVRITRLFLTLILKDELGPEYLRREIFNFNIVCIQAWIKCNVLCCEIDNETKFLTNYISNLPEIRNIFGTEADATRALLLSDEPIINFFVSLARRRKSLTPEQCASFDATCKPFFNNIDKWALQTINEDNKDTRLSNWIYKCIGTFIYHCSAMLYVKNQANNMLRTLINKVALPPAQQQQQQHYLMCLAEKIFPSLVLSMEELNLKSDISLQTLARELFEAYLPRLVKIEDAGENSFKVSEALSKCFLRAKPDFARAALDVLALNFVNLSQSGNTHRCCSLVMLLLRTLVKTGNTNFNSGLLSIITIFIPPALTCYVKLHDYHPHRQQTISFLRDLFKNPILINDSSMRKKVNEAANGVIKKYAKSHAKTCAEFIRSVQRINLELFNHLYSGLEQVVLECESSREPYSAALRYALNGIKLL